MKSGDVGGRRSQGTIAAKIRMLCMPGMQAAMEELGPQFEDATGHKLSVRFQLPSQSQDALDSGAFDLVAFNSNVIDDLIKQEKVIPDTCSGVARMGIGVAVRAGAPRPDISTVQALRRTLRHARSISYTKDSGAGVYLASMMERLGIAEEMKAKTTLMAGGGQNPRAVANGDVELGLSVIGDILPAAGVVLLGPLPPELQHYVTVTAGVGTRARDREAAGEVVRFLTAPTVAAVLTAKGLEPIVTSS